MSQERNRTGGGRGTNGYVVIGSSAAGQPASRRQPAPAQIESVRSAASSLFGARPVPADEEGLTACEREYLDDKEGAVYAVADRLIDGRSDDETSPYDGWSGAASAARGLRTVTPCERRDRALLRWAHANADEDARPVYAWTESFLDEAPEAGGPQPRWRPKRQGADAEAARAFGDFVRRQGGEAMAASTSMAGAEGRIVTLARTGPEGPWVVVDWSAQSSDPELGSPSLSLEEDHLRSHTLSVVADPAR